MPMARFTSEGFNELSEFFGNISDIPDDVTDEMLLAQADIVEKAQIAKGAAYGVMLTGVTLSSIKVGKIVRSGGSKSIKIVPEGSNADGNRNAEVAFLNEFGVPSKGMAARPFISDANEEAADPATDAAAQILFDWQDS